MIYMNKLIFALVFLGSCASFTVEDYKLIATSVFRTYPDMILTKEFIDSKDYSFIKVKIDRADPVIMSLVSIEKNIYTWVSETNEKLITKNGKIIRTEGLDHDFSILNTSEIDLANKTIELLIQLQNPQALISQTSSISVTESLVKHSSKNYENTVIYTEDFKSKRFNWKGQNYYWKSLDLDLVIRTHQHFHPYQPSYDIQFYYKFSE